MFDQIRYAYHMSWLEKRIKNNDTLHPKYMKHAIKLRRILTAQEIHQDKKIRKGL